jgi:hypothetical protein
MASVRILNPMVYGKIKLLAPIINPDTHRVMYDTNAILSWNDFVKLLSLGIEKIDIEPAQEGVTV